MDAKSQVVGRPTRMEVDVVVIGAGPTGLVLANLLGNLGVRVAVLEQLHALIDYPRGVSMDDETLRVLQAAGVVDECLPFTVPNQRIEYVTAHGRRLGGYAPVRDDFGWPAKSGFIQPAIDQVLADALQRYTNVNILMGHEVQSLTESAEGVNVDILDSKGTAMMVRAKYVVGCDGGRSSTRKAMGAQLQGSSESRRWLVMDLRNDPIGRPNVTVLCDPRRPSVSIGLPRGIRRLEFMLFDDEEDVDFNLSRARELAAPLISHLEADDIIRMRVYQHHSVVASSFRVRRLFIAGDAAHLMPVWQGQGYNTGVRDAVNLAWKLAMVIKGDAGDALLETYDIERRPHAASMVNLSRITGKYLGMTSPAAARTRNAITLVAGAIPSFRDYFMQMKFKPMPRYSGGAITRSVGESPVGRLFIQPRVRVPGETRPFLLDDVIGAGFAVLRWGADPRHALSEQSQTAWDSIGATFIKVLPMTQWESATAEDTSNGRSETLVVGDEAGRLRRWFDAQPYGMIFLRPDRIVAAACQPQEAEERSRELAKAIALTSARLATSR